MAPSGWTSSVNSRVSNNSCGCTEVLRPSQNTNHHLALSGIPFSQNIPSNWLNLPPHPPCLLLASDQSLSLKWKHTAWPLSLSVPMPDLLSSPPNGRPRVTSFFSLLFCHLIPLKGHFSLERLCKLSSASASPSRFFVLWLKPDGNLKARFGPSCSGPRTLTQMFPLLLCVFVLFLL